jgi:N-acetylglucosamine repressor
MASLSVLHILRTIKEHGILSRTDLQQITRLSWGTITNTTRELLDRNLIREEGTLQTKSGRKPMRLAVNPDGHCLIGVDLSPTLIRCLATNLSGEALDYHESPVAPEDAPLAILDRAATLIQQILHNPALANRLCLGVGLAAAGAVDIKRGILRFSPRMPAWTNVPVREYLQLKVSTPVMLEHDTNCLALAQRWFGETAAAEDALCIHLGDTLGMGILHHGEIFRGAQDMSGQLAHITVNPEGPLCTCGDYGCLESYCTLPALFAAVRANASAHSAAVQSKLPNITLEDLTAAAQAQDPAALALFTTLGKHLGIALANLIDLFNPNIIVLSGPLTAAADFFLPTVNDQVNTHAWKHSQRHITLSTLGNRNIALGACGMVLQSIFEQNASDTDIPILQRA